MTAVRIDLPDDLSAFVNERVAQSGYESAEAYLLALLRRDRLNRLAPKATEKRVRFVRIQTQAIAFGKRIG